MEAISRFYCLKLNKHGVANISTNIFLTPCAPSFQTIYPPAGVRAPLVYVRGSRIARHTILRMAVPRLEFSASLSFCLQEGLDQSKASEESKKMIKMTRRVQSCFTCNVRNDESINL